MTSYEDIGKKYAERILRSVNAHVEADHVFRELSTVRYKEEQSPITLRTRNELVLYMLKSVIDDVISKKSADNARYLDLIAHIVQQLQESKK